MEYQASSKLQKEVFWETYFEAPGKPSMFDACHCLKSKNGVAKMRQGTYQDEKIRANFQLKV